ncbi:MAG: M23 family metallopeptidase [Oscillospiraceae bacterium]|nr:M23 family metallopeptidase [Oscillospiraceae bacterium]
MQNKFKGFRNFMKVKGYYIALLLCTAVVGVTGYYLLTDKGTGTVPPSESGTEHKSNVATTDPTSSSEAKTPDKPAANLTTDQGKAEGSSNGAVPFTLQKPVSGEVLSHIAVDHLSYNETTRDWRTHEGMDLAAQPGDSVCAAAAGTVYTIYEDEHLGMTVVLHHSGGYSTHYSNLSEDIPVAVGDSLHAGDVLGTVGQSACIEQASAPHVHFALYRNNAPLDPEDFLS